MEPAARAMVMPSKTKTPTKTKHTTTDGFDQPKSALGNFRLTTPPPGGIFRSAKKEVPDEMAEKNKKTPAASRKPAVQVRLENEEVEAFNTLVERRAAQAAKTGGTASASSVLRGLVRDALLSEGLLTVTSEDQAGPK